MTLRKSYGLFLIILGPILGHIGWDDLFTMSYWVASGLTLIFFSPERINDERVQQLKMKALFTTMTAALGLTFFVSLVISRMHHDGAGLRSALFSQVSALEMLAGVMALSLGLFYFYRWQDGRADRVK